MRGLAPKNLLPQMGRFKYRLLSMFNMQIGHDPDMNGYHGC
jgi:hypothetical protein